MNAFADAGWSLLVDVTLKSTVLLGAMALVLAAWRPRNAAVAHRVWTIALAAMLALPALVCFAPSISLPAGVYPHFVTDGSGMPTARRRGHVIESATPPAFAVAEAAAVPREGIGGEEADPLDPGLGVDTTESPITTAPRPPQAAGLNLDVRVGFLAAAGLAVYLGGAAWWGARLAAGLWQTRRIVTRARPVEMAMRDGFAGLAASVLESDDVTVPLTVGIFRRAILLPADWRTWDEPLLEAVLAHEGEHVRRRDAAVAALAGVNAALYWFHPGAWWLRRRLADLAEQVCDDAVIAATGNRAGYARSLLAVAARLSSAGRRTKARGVAMARTPQVERRIGAIIDAERPLSRRLGAASAVLQAGLVLPLLVIVAGLRAERESSAAEDVAVDAAAPAPVAADSITLAGHCRDGEAPVAGARLRVFRIDSTLPAEQILETQSQDDGRFKFAGLPAPPAREERPTWHYVVVATAPGRASGTRRYDSGSTKGGAFQFDMPAAASLRGRVTDHEGNPVAGAVVWAWSASGLVEPLDGILSAMADADGRFDVSDVRPWDPNNEEPQPLGNGQLIEKGTTCYLMVQHPNFGKKLGPYQSVPAKVDMSLEPAATIVGVVFDEVDGVLAAGVTVSMQATDDSLKDLVGAWQQTKTDARGRYRFTSVSKGKYNIWANAKDRTCAAVDSLQTTAGKQVAAPFLRLIEGGWIEGVVVDAAGEPLATNIAGQPLQIGLYGPSRPKSGAAIQSTTVNDKGQFRLRAAPGANSPYICVSMDGQRVDGPGTVDVAAGETTRVLFRVLPAGRVLGRQANLPPVELPLPVEEERKAAAEIRRLGGWYKLDDEAHVVEVNMVYYDGDGQRRDNNQIVDTALEHVPAFRRLKALMLKEGQATDEGLRHIRGMEQLERILMWDAAKVTDEGAAHLATLPNLRYIHLSNAAITDKSIGHWRRLPLLAGLSLQGNRFTDRGLELASTMPQLRDFVVGMSSGSITDEGVAHLSRLTNLERLDLQRSEVTDAGLKHLAGLGRLRTLWLGGTKATAAGVAELKKSAPDLEDQRSGVGGGGRSTRRDAAGGVISAEAPPKLAYLAWQALDAKAGESAVGPIWDATGDVVDVETAAELSRLLDGPVFQRRPEDAHLNVRPLVLWFEDDSPLESRSVMASVVTADGKRESEGTSLNARMGKYRISAAAPRKPFEWGRSVTLTIKFPVEAPQVVKELHEIPTEATPIDDGAEWLGVVEADGRLASTLRIWQKPREDSLVSYGARLFAKGRQWPADTDGGVVHTFDDRQERVDWYQLKGADVDLVRLTRQSHATATIEDVPLRFDLLPVSAAGGP